MGLTSLSRVMVFGLLAVVLTGCGLLFPSMYSDPFYNDPIPSFGPTVSFTSGSATVDLVDGQDETVNLDELVSGGSDYGMIVATWRGADGWSMTLTSYDLPGMPNYPGDNTISLQRVHNDQIWVADMTWNPTACTVTITTSTDSRLEGKAHCTSLRWADGTVPQGMGMTPPNYIDDQDPFGAEITFQAGASDSQTS